MDIRTHHTVSPFKVWLQKGQLKDILQTKTGILDLHNDLDFDHSNQIFLQDIPAYGELVIK